MAKRKPPVALDVHRDTSRFEQLVVVGNRDVDGHQPGDTFEREIGPREEMLITAGHLARAADAPTLAELEDDPGDG